MKKIINGNVKYDRISVANNYLRGKGIEIGALHNPLTLPKSAHVKYVDRMSSDELRAQYPELRNEKLVHVDIIDDGEMLEQIAEGSQDFIIANHFLEHCQNPLQAISNFYKALRTGGVLYMALPDKRYTFDAKRPVTTLEHLQRDFIEGPTWSRRSHFEEWCEYVNLITDPEESVRRVEHLMSIDYSIHYHVWSQKEMLELILFIKDKFLFEVELLLKIDNEQIIILRKNVNDG